MTSVPNAGRRRDAWDGLKTRAARVPLALWIVLLLGIELRVALALAYQPASMGFLDSAIYVQMAAEQLFADPARTAGYSMLLRALNTVSAQLEVTIAFQHLLGLGTALLVYGTFRRLAVPSWVAVAGAAGVLLSLDQIFLEHSIVSETPFTFLFATTLYAAVRSLEEPRAMWRTLTTRHAWILAAGLALGLSAWMRSLTVLVVPLLALWFAFALAGPWRARLGHAGLSLAASLVMLLAYAGLNAAHSGYFGITPSSGWAFYARTAQFADCSRFDPPAGTEELCETTPPADRPGPDFYAWEEGSPARDLYRWHPRGNDELTAFAREAVLNQPLDYLRVVAIDSLRYFRPRLDNRLYGGVGYELIDIDRRIPAVEQHVNEVFNRYYTDDQLEVHGLAGSLADLQQAVLRLGPVAMLLVTLLALAGLVLARGRLRTGLVLILGSSAALLLIPPATAIWSARYAVPASGPLVGAAAVGLWLLPLRVRDIRSARQAR